MEKYGVCVISSALAEMALYCAHTMKRLEKPRHRSMKGHSMKLTALMIVLLLSACDQSASSEIVKSLIANPGRLKVLRKQCKDGYAKRDGALCSAAAEATRNKGTLYKLEAQQKN